MTGSQSRIAYIISSHGFGHASRSAAIMNSLSRLTQCHFDIFSEVPQWFFGAEGIKHRYHRFTTDVGLIQSSPLQQDIALTLTALAHYVADLEKNASHLADLLQKNDCQIALCDISPLGIVAAQKAGIPSVLIENFTWDWLYTAYATQYPAFNAYISQLREIFLTSNYLIQTTPICEKRNSSITTHPVSRCVRQSSDSIRQLLTVPQQHHLVSVTMGGIQDEYHLLDQLTPRKDVTFVLPGSTRTIQRIDNCIMLPHNSWVYHPDLINASDVVVGKLGYSTLAEVYYAGVPYIYVMRSDFRESDCLAHFVNTQMQGLPMQADEFQQGQWLEYLQKIPSTKPHAPNHINGAEQAAEWIVNIMSNSV